MTTTTSRNGRSGGKDQLFLAQTPPVDEEAEKAVLGALLLYNDPKKVFALMERGLTVGCFYWERHQAVYAAIVSLTRQMVGADPLTVRAEMAKLGTKDPGTVADIDALAGWVPAAGNLIHYADIVIDMARWRKRQSVSYELLDAVGRRDQDAWAKLAKIFAPEDEVEPEANVVILRTVNEDGEVVGEVRHCPSCEEFKDQVKGLEKDLRVWRIRHANLARDKEAEAREDGMWMTAQRLFEMWKKLTGHSRSPFTADRFFECSPFLRRREHGPEKVARAIVGISYDPFTTKRKNGTTKRFNEWVRIFESSDRFEDWCVAAPSDWRDKLSPDVKKLLGEEAPSEKRADDKQLRAVGVS